MLFAILLYNRKNSHAGFHVIHELEKNCKINVCDENKIEQMYIEHSLQVSTLRSSDLN